MDVIVWSRRWTEFLPIKIVYDDLMELIGGDDNLSKGYREKVMGKTCVKTYSTEYLQLIAIEDKTLSFSQWRSWKIEDRARYIARIWLKSMADTIDAHYREQDELEKKTKDELSKRSKT